MSREQKLVDICFQLVLTATSPKHKDNFKDFTPEEMAAWVSKQLNICGFETEPCGASWGVLK